MLPDKLPTLKDKLKISASVETEPETSTEAISTPDTEKVDNETNIDQK